MVRKRVLLQVDDQFALELKHQLDSDKLASENRLLLRPLAVKLGGNFYHLHPNKRTRRAMHFTPDCIQGDEHHCEADVRKPNRAQHVYVFFTSLQGQRPDLDGERMDCIALHHVCRIRGRGELSANDSRFRVAGWRKVHACHSGISLRHVELWQENVIRQGGALLRPRGCVFGAHVDHCNGVQNPRPVVWEPCEIVSPAHG